MSRRTAAAAAAAVEKEMTHEWAKQKHLQELCVLGGPSERKWF